LVYFQLTPVILLVFPSLSNLPILSSSFLPIVSRETLSRPPPTGHTQLLRKLLLPDPQYQSESEPSESKSLDRQPCVMFTSQQETSCIRTDRRVVHSLWRTLYPVFLTTTNAEIAQLSRGMLCPRPPRRIAEHADCFFQHLPAEATCASVTDRCSQMSRQRSASGGPGAERFHPHR